MACATERLIALALTLTLAPRPAAALAPAEAAEARKIVVVPLVVEGKLPADVQARLAQELVTGIGEGATPAAAGTATCADAKCWRMRAGELGATHLIRGTIAVDDRDYAVSAELIEGETGAVVATASRRCEICGYDELSETVDDVAGLLRRKLDASSAALPVLSVDSTPPGALVTIDGDRVGTTPVELTLAPGPHDVRISKDGHVAQLERVVAVEGVHGQVSVRLDVAPDAQGSGQKPSAFLVAGATTTALGIAGVGVGIGLVFLDENPIESRCQGDDKDIEGHCKYRYESLTAGLTLVGLGAASLVTGIVLLAVDARRKKRAKKVAVLPSASGLVLRF